MILPRQRDQRLARFRLRVGGVDHGQATGGQAFGSDELEHIEGVVCCGLVVLVVGHQAATEVG